MKNEHLTVMLTDVKGFTVRTSQSSREELHRFLELHDQLLGPLFKQFGGRVIKTIGDAFLVTFRSPTDALLCGMEIQRVLCRHNEKATKNECLEVRVAINSGEVTLKDRDIFGEPVNITARLEGIAEAGDIYFTESVYLAMNKKEIPTAEVGYRHFKGIPAEIKVYKVLNESQKKDPKTQCVIIPSNSQGGSSLPGDSASGRNYKKWLKIVGVVLIIIFALALIRALGNQKREKEFLEEKLNNQPGDVQNPLWREFDKLQQDFEKAFQDGGENVENIINQLGQISNELGNPPRLQKIVDNATSKFSNAAQNYDQLREKANQIREDILDARRQNDIPRLEEGLNALQNISDSVNNPPEFEQMIKDLRANLGPNNEAIIPGEIIEKEGFSIFVPEGWDRSSLDSNDSLKVTNNMDTVSDPAAQKLNFRTHYTVNHDMMSGRDMDEYIGHAKDIIRQMVPEIEFLHEEPIDINGNGGHFMEAHADRLNAHFHSTVYLIKGHDDDIWTINFNSTAGDWPKYERLFQKVANSFILN